ncbi:MAG: hcaC [Ignavibacteria bacterium]|nr:hcaC [Ignavibacteria bacterium]
MVLENSYDKEYITICKSAELYEKKGKLITFAEDEDFQLALFRIDGKLFCVGNICPHRHAARIHEGILDGINVTCPEHGWEFSLETGENTNKHQGIRRLTTFEIFESEGEIYIEQPHFEIPLWRTNAGIE